MKEGLRYRPDIDGLRALAVLVVVAFHYGVTGLAGGFVGVDVFFVISGYLITTLIVTDLAADRFTIREFYLRRVRRIFPALFTVLAVAAVAAVALLLPNDLFVLRRSLAAATLFSSNLYFYRATDYFAPPEQEQPLLHTWSLSVEEQFYLVFPVLMLLLYRYARRRIALVLAVITAASFALAAWMVSQERVAAAFYLLPMRAWELGVGALLALGVVRLPRRPPARHALSVIGVALILFAAVAYDAGTAFPGVSALPPVLGTALLIAAGERSLVGRVLALPPVVFVGLISYSLYLWHFPLLVFYRAYTLDQPSVRARVVLAAASLVLAVLSWRFVEQPFRRRRPSYRALAAWSLATLLVFVGVAFALRPVADRLNPPSALARRVLTFDNLRDPAQTRRGSCFVSSITGGERYDTARCLAAVPGQRRFLLVGDSHAAHLWRAAQDVLPEVSVEQATVTGCHPVVPVAGSAKCVAMLRQLLDEHLPAGGVDTVVLSARWRMADLARLPGTVALLRRWVRRVVVLGPNPEYSTRLPKLLARALDTGDDDYADDRRSDRPVVLDAALRRLQPSAGFEYVSLTDAVCGAGRCQEYAAPGVPMLFDESHFTLPGSRVVAARIRSAIAGDPASGLGQP